MRFNLIRIYGNQGTNGYLIAEGKLVCKTIELPWRMNQPNVSCIPEGQYILKARYSPRFGHCVEVVNVPNRSHILLHPANNALRELRGCIAPVSELTGQGTGLRSRAATQRFLEVFNRLKANGNSLILNIHT
ncbi:DUF5675 family protein [Cryomorphaceae bacterium 1068]|nr:DUF5675 family protein [Cryomorphaceae bacterium 1068]